METWILNQLRHWENSPVQSRDHFVVSGKLVDYVFDQQFSFELLNQIKERNLQVKLPKKTACIFNCQWKAGTCTQRAALHSQLLVDQNKDLIVSLLSPLICKSRRHTAALPHMLESINGAHEDVFWASDPFKSHSRAAAFITADTIDFRLGVVVDFIP